MSTHVLIITLTIGAASVSCAHRLPNGGDWASELAARPGSSLPPEGSSQAQVLTFFGITQSRSVGKQHFLAGSGYVAFNGGGSTLAGPNRNQNPYIELTIANRRDPMLASCLQLLAPESFTDGAVQISGSGYFAALPGVQLRQLALVRLLNLTGCKVVPRR